MHDIFSKGVNAAATFAKENEETKKIFQQETLKKKLKNQRVFLGENNAKLEQRRRRVWRCGKDWTGSQTRSKLQCSSNKSLL